MRNAVLTILAVLAVFGTMPAAASHIQGIKVTVVNLDAGTLTADVDVTQYTNEGITTGTNTAQIYETGGYAPISWGEGETLSPMTLTAMAGGPPSVFQGSFQHTYSGPGPFTVRVVSDSSATNPGGETITGNRIDLGTAGNYEDVFTNTTIVDFSQVPVASKWALGLLSLLLAGAGALLLRR